MDILNYISCPSCKSTLEIHEDGLICKGCSQKFYIDNGIPILIDMDKLPPHLVGQIKYFSDETTSTGKTYKLEEWQKSYLNRFQEEFGLEKIRNSLIIDCGVGSGYMSIELAKLGATVIAMDLTLSSLQRLKLIIEKLNLKDKIIPLCCSAEDLPIKSEVADFFISNAVLEHLPRESQGIAEINRVVKSHGGCMIAVPILYRKLNPLLVPVNYIHDKRIGHLRRYSEAILAQKFDSWNIKRTYYTGHTAKVFKTLANQFIRPVFNDRAIEQLDRKKEQQERNSSNLICLLQR